MNLLFGSKVPGAGLAPAEGGTVDCYLGDWLPFLSCLKLSGR